MRIGFYLFDGQDIVAQFWERGIDYLSLSDLQQSIKSQHFLHTCATSSYVTVKLCTVRMCNAILWNCLNPFTPRISWVILPVVCHTVVMMIVLRTLCQPWLIPFFILVNCLLDKVLILKGEILSWSLVEFSGVTVNLPDQIGLCFEAKHVHCCRPEFDRKHWSVGACIPAEGRQCLSPLGL